VKRWNVPAILALAIALGGVTAALLVLEGCAPKTSPPTATPAPTPTPACDGWEVLWEDEFDGSGSVDANGLNVDNWTVETGVCVNDEQQTYVTHTMNVRVEDGTLILEAHDASPESGACPGCYGDRFTSGRIMSKGKREFEYGRFEARIRLPSGEGLWPAFWLLGGNIDQVGWPQCGEIDILENLGYEHWVAGAVHGPGFSGAESMGYTYTLPSGQVTGDWHVYQVNWSPDSIRWYVDGQPVHALLRLTVLMEDGQWVFDHPHFVVLNLALGGHYPYAYNAVDAGVDGGCYGLPGPTIDTLPQRVEIDWVRVCALPSLSSADRVQAASGKR
jgi:beta-glucanase (GH16 family)